ncbi:sodium-coupled monocarboxylate transporter 1-like [Ylistrum balloti]|uniref:sodium-coupled monocarboxylate transporter 1-like n=1 Tax=Ylistrum balloti TaxID=509963 RepID=UPI0029059785|nr:sodium-coupled monocarboxylate transporter 1-like [Ylistrum balloti]
MAFLKLEDYVIFIITLTFSLGIGLFYSLRGGNQRTTRQFILGDGNMWYFPLALSLMVSYESGIMMLGVPAEVYMYGMQWYMSSIGNLFGRIVALYLLIPSQRKLDVTSVYEYFELRYQSHGLRLFATVLSLLSLVNYLGSVVFVPAVTLEIVADIPMEISIITLMAVVLIYTIIGGFTAVIWTDVFQAILMCGGMFAILIKGTIEAGGLTKTWTTVMEKGRFNMFDFDPDPTLRQSFWSLFIGDFIRGLRMPFTQTTFQRIKATRSVSAAKRMFFVSSLLSVGIAMLAVLSGAVMFSYYHATGCDPLVAKQVGNQNQLMAKMVRDVFQDTPCLPGLFLAALFSASLSTMSSMLSAISALFWEDIIKPHTKPMSDKKSIRITQTSAFLFGGFAIVIAYAITGIKGPISRILDVTGACMGGAVSGMMFLGWFVPTANALGASVGGFVSFVIVGWISFGKLLSPGVRVHAILEPASTKSCPIFNISKFTNTTVSDHTSWTDWNSTIGGTTPVSVVSGPQGLDVLYSLSYKWLFPIGILLVLIVGTIVSRLQARKPIDPGLVVPVCDHLCFCIPERFRRKLRGGVKYPKTDEKIDEDKAEAMDVLVLD